MKKAFTMIELIFILVVIGILAVVIIPRTKTNSLQEAAVQLISHIRYTQHLAMISDKYGIVDLSDSDNEANEWYKGRWQILFYSGAAAENKEAYTIFSDRGKFGGDASKLEIAINPENSNQVMSGGFSGSNSLDIRKEEFIGIKKMNLGLSYGITNVEFKDGCAGYVHLTFDKLGRPITGTHNKNGSSHSLIKEKCTIELSNEDESISIIIEPETGYSRIQF